MSSRTLAIVAITTQVVLGLILVAILVTLQGHDDGLSELPWCQPNHVLNCQQPVPVTVVP